MNHPERGYQEQWERVQRLVLLATAKDQHAGCPGLRYYDIAILTLQAMWSLKDWILNDSNFGAKSIADLRKDIFESRVLLVCSDLANGTKHFRIDNPKTGIGIHDRGGLHVDSSKGIYQELVYLRAQTPTDPLHGREVREVIEECHGAWQDIIDKHYLSYVE